MLAAVDPSEAEAATCESLLAAVVANWPQMQGSSIAALRETFLEREGVASQRADGWRVEVERKTLDVLLDGLPWSYSMILHPWMGKPIAVEW